MHRLLRNRPYAGAMWLATLCLLAIADVAHAHKLELFAAAEGDAVTGRAYFPGGGKARNIRVEVLGPNGTKLGEVMSDAEGRFAFQAKLLCDHTFVAETVDGHRAAYTVSAEELPQNLPPLTAAPAPPLPGEEPGVISGLPLEEAHPPVAAEQPHAEPGLSRDELQGIVEKAVSRQVQPLREQLDRYDGKGRLHDVLAGIGYIVGVSGVVFYLLASARKKAERGGPA